MNLFKDQAIQIARQPLIIRLGVFISSLLLLWIPLALPIYGVMRDPNWVSILTMGILYVEFLGLVKWWGRYIYEQPLFRRYGLVGNRKNAQDLLLGFSLGLVSLLALLSLESTLGWLAWQPPSANFPRIALEGLAVAVGVGFAEELLFRGWLLDELQRDYRRSVATGVNACIFALLHFIKPFPEMLRTLPAFPGLFLLGLTLVWTKKAARGKLGLPMGLHGGLVWGYYLVHVGQLIDSQDKVPVWVTGIDQNPLAGVMGMLCLSTIAVGMKKAAKVTSID